MSDMRRHLVIPAVLCAVFPATVMAQRGKVNCDPENGGLKLPAGFCATLFADSVQGARSMVVMPNGDVFVSRNSRSNGIIVLRDADHDGHAETRAEFASGFLASQLAVFENHLYTDALPLRPPQGAPPRTASILRYPLKAGELTPAGPRDTIVAGLPGEPGH